MFGLGTGCSEGVEPAPPRPPSDAGFLVEVTELPASDGGACEPFAPARLTGSFMATGRPCLECHDDTGSAPPFTAAGTVFDDLAQDDYCEGTEGIRVIVTDAAGESHVFQTNLAGNFYFTEPLEFPITARLVAGGRVREMGQTVDTGDCNGCHTPEGAEDAPGRIVSPLLP